MPIIGANPWWMVRPSGLDVSTRALLAAMTSQQTSARIAAIDTAIRRLKASGVFDRCGLLYDMCATNINDSCINWKSPGKDTLRILGAPIHLANKGVKRVTSGDIFTLGKPLSGEHNVTDKDAHIAIYISEFVAGNGSAAGSGGGGSYYWLDRRVSTSAGGDINSSTPTPLSIINGTDKFISLSARGPTENIACAGSSLAKGTVTRLPVPPGNFYVLGRDANATTNNTIGFVSVGAAIDDVHQMYAAIINDYMTSIGNGGPL